MIGIPLDKDDLSQFDLFVAAETTRTDACPREDSDEIFFFITSLSPFHLLTILQKLK